VDNFVITGRQEYTNDKGLSGNSIPPDSSPSKDETSPLYGNQMFQNFTTHEKDDGFATLEQVRNTNHIFLLTVFYSSVLQGSVCSLGYIFNSHMDQSCPSKFYSRNVSVLAFCIQKRMFTLCS
jgi:hypothetical protein